MSCLKTGGQWSRKRVSERWGMPFWEIVRDLHAQDLNRSESAQAIGMNIKFFMRLLNDNDQHNPWGSSVVGNYIRETGEQFGDALRRMAAAGYSWREANIEIGYSGSGCNRGLRYAMKARGIEVEFKKKSKPKQKMISNGPGVCRCWPTWEKVNEIVKQKQIQ